MPEYARKELWHKRSQPSLHSIYSVPPCTYAHDHILRLPLLIQNDYGKHKRNSTLPGSGDRACLQVQVNNNLSGTAEFCPVIRKTKQLNEHLVPDFKQLVRELTKKFPPDIFYRAVNYLYRKETKSSYQIEREEPTPDRMDRFVSILERAGEDSLNSLLSESTLTGLQNSIVDARFAVKSFRNDQNFISSTNYNFKETYHYISPPPQFVQTLMNGLSVTAKRMEEEHPVIQAAAVAFAFVFIHPFEDGNGRIHRFLIHDFLIRNQVVEKGMIIPVSAHMLNHT